MWLEGMKQLNATYAHECGFGHTHLAEQQARDEVQRLDVNAVRQLVALLRQLALAAAEDARVVDQAVDVIELLRMQVPADSEAKLIPACKYGPP